MHYSEAKELYDRAAKFLDRELQWSNGKQLIPCRFIEISGTDLSDPGKKNYRLFAVLEPKDQKRFTESLKSIVGYLEEN